MKILLLSDTNNAHTLRWVEALSTLGFEVGVFGLDIVKSDFYSNHPHVSVFAFDRLSKTNTVKNGGLNKLSYLFSLHQLKLIIKTFQPDIVHAHYASSYGLLGVLSGFHPLILSVWGSDVFCFPKVSPIHKYTLKWILRNSDYILSTSKVMATETAKYTSKMISITPFGIDCQLFSPSKEGKKEDRTFIVGCTKTLAPIYGIDILIKAFAVISHDIDAKLKLLGEGPSYLELKQLTEKLNISDKVEFLGRKPIAELPYYYNDFDVAVYLSKSESFGVVALEAMACECPLIVSKAAGFIEVVPSEAGIFIDCEDVQAVAESLRLLYKNKELRKKMGAKGRKYVTAQYQWKENVDTMVNIYNGIFVNYFNKCKITD